MWQIMYDWTLYWARLSGSLPCRSHAPNEVDQVHGDAVTSTTETQSSPVTGESNQRSERTPASIFWGSETRIYTHLRGDAAESLAWLVEWFSLGHSWGEGHLLLVGTQLDQYGYGVGNLLTSYKDKALLDIN